MNVPSFRVFRSGGTSECTLVPFFVPGEHPPNHPFGNHPLPTPDFLSGHAIHSFFAEILRTWTSGQLGAAS